jgi:hypothetical protein
VVLDDRELLQEEGGELLTNRFVHTHPMIGLDNSSVKRAIGSDRTRVAEHRFVILVIPWDTVASGCTQTLQASHVV